MEFVPNHSSYKCEWFSKSIKQEDKYRDYYMWRNASNQDQLDNSSVTPIPPNNWVINRNILISTHLSLTTLSDKLEFFNDIKLCKQNIYDLILYY